MIVVGCPIKNRAWIFPEWLRYVQDAFEAVGEIPHFAIVVGTSGDDTFEVVQDALRDQSSKIVHLVEDPCIGIERQWNDERYSQMCEARNVLLNEVRKLQPDYFLSLDSDILLHPQALMDLLETIQGADAVGGKVYLVPPPERYAPSYAQLTSFQTLQRPDSTGVFPVDVIMAVKLMRQSAYSVDYRPNVHGEDIGFSGECRRRGLSLMWDGRTCSKHVMSREMLVRIDPRCGY